MGRQKTIWINEDRNAKIEAIQGASQSEKIGMCIDAYEVDEQLLVVALRAQIKYFKLFMKGVVKDLKHSGHKVDAMKYLAAVIEEELS